MNPTFPLGLLLLLLITGVFTVHPDYILSRVWPSEPIPTTTRGSAVVEPTISPNLLCCKLGERVGNRKLHCNIELLIRTDNTVFKHKQKLYHEHASDSFNRRRYYSHQVGSLQDLNTCASYKKIFEKCCIHRRNSLDHRNEFLDITFDVPSHV